MATGNAAGCFRQFREQLRIALAHLYDPYYQPPALLYAVTGCDPQQGAGPLQSRIARAIQGLEPPADTPPAARSWGDYRLLKHRFVLQLTQEEAAERLGLSVRTLRRHQREATHALARLLWERGVGAELSIRQSESAATATEVEAVDWRSQVRRDVASLHSTSAAKVATVREIVRSAVELEAGLASRHGLSLSIGMVPNTPADIHPSALRQILIMVIAQFGRAGVSGSVDIEGVLEDGFILLSLTGPMESGDRLPAGELIREILDSEGGSLEVTCDGHRACFRIRVPAAGEVHVLVVDDNLDSVHYYRRCTTGTRYRILHAPQARAAAAAIAAAKPDIIVLDIMLPDADGWELLQQLQANLGTCTIPIIVCSIVREEDLASALGAVLYLPKPVRHREFLLALDRALGLASAVSGDFQRTPQ